jgi:hypothetical protein
MTPRDLINLALKQAGVLGVGQTSQAEDINDAFTILNMMVSQWNKRRWLIFRLVDLAFIANGSGSYTIGPAGNFVSPRPDRLEAAFIRINGVDYPLTVLQSREDYNRIPIKTIAGTTHSVFYDPTFPVGTLYTYPVANAGYELHLTVKMQITKFANLSEEINLPEEYQEAILYNLIPRLWTLFQMTPNASLFRTTAALAASALNTIRNANIAVPLLVMPPGLDGGGFYNVYTDEVV